MSAVHRFAEWAGRPDEEIDLARAAASIALDEYPDLPIDEVVSRLDALAAEARPNVTPESPPPERIARLNHFLFTEVGFRGDPEDYYNPKNSYLNDVLDRKIGIPITLSLVYMEVARRLALPISGVGFPGHFLVRHEGTPEVIVDPFAGRTVTREDLKRRVQQTHGKTARLDPRLLATSGPREILARMLRNLKAVYMQRSDPGRAIGMSHRILLLTPDDPEEIRDRGALYLKLEYFPGALEDFERYLELVPDGNVARRIRAALPELRQSVVRLQ